ncbi:DUF6458 family protein [Schumannella sp. 10F1B-5-1]|uniref:DUF6458 family protein n=1 Tax=Schumannella sp. 10F1B-5-1 TaxID=2590780 RepID=UPI001131E6B5|nr:DUF6458 family protein [Schumannella sp. 10F1B-5-1]TPW73013.1 hypothetical protein FJ658_07125 [Schumannella sp. 10F1B-5-1]
MIAGGIVLFVIGAILAFAVSFAVPGVSLPIIGAILMVAGVVLFIIGLVATLRGRVTTERRTVDPDGGVRVQQRVTDDEPR